MADAKTAILLTIDPAHEGGFQRNPNDRANWTGGKIGVGELVGTKYGITCLDLPGVDIENLTVDQAVDFYENKFWNPLYSGLVLQSVANKIFDMGVLFGVRTAVRCLQRAVGVLAADGDFGPITLSAVNYCYDDGGILLDAFRKELHAEALRIVGEHPIDADFAADWNRRIDL